MFMAEGFCGRILPKTTVHCLIMYQDMSFYYKRELSWENSCAYKP